MLSTLTHAPAAEVKLLAEELLETIGTVTVLVQRTGLVMLPYTDSAQGSIFHLGEVLVSEAHVQLADGTQGYAMCTGRDLVQTLAVAIIDAAARANLETTRIQAFVVAAAATQATEDALLMRHVEATRVEMETF